jgi:hypothetical protein
MERGKPSKEGVLYQRDADTVILIMAMGIEIVETQRVEGTVWFGFREEEAGPILDSYYHNKAIPMDDARRWIWAKGLFQTIVFER